MSAGFLQHLQHAIGVIGTSPKPEPDVKVCDVSAEAEAPGAQVLEATARSIVVDLDGHVLDVGRICHEHIPGLRPGIRLLDLVHISDRIAWMTALSAFKNGAASSVSHLRLNKAGIQSPQMFASFCFGFESAADARIRIDVWENQTGNVAPGDGARPGDDLLAVMSHELRTPLNAILGFSGLLNHAVSEALTDEQKAEYVHLIHSAADHMLAMVNGILDVSKIGAGKYEIHPEPFDFERVVDEAVSLVATQARTKQIRINVRPVVDGFGDIFADRRAVKQVLINLLSNAVKFTPTHGCVTIDAWFEGQTLAFAVSDTGIGMTEADQATIFSAFNQIDNGTTREAEGTGLGLCLVKGLVGLHGGEVSVSSSKNVGTKMLVKIPNAQTAKGTADRIETNEISRGGMQDALRQSA